MKPPIFSCLTSRVLDNGSLYGRFLFGPLPIDISLTLATILRRSLLHSKAAYAIVSAEIEGATHEYASLPGIQESVLEIALNLGEIVLTSKERNLLHPNLKSSFQKNFMGKQTSVAFLKISGPCVVTAKDIKWPKGIICVKPNAYIATLSTNACLALRLKITSTLNPNLPKGIDFNNFAASATQNASSLQDKAISSDSAFRNEYGTIAKTSLPSVISEEDSPEQHRGERVFGSRDGGPQNLKPKVLGSKALPLDQRSQRSRLKGSRLTSLPNVLAISKAFNKPKSITQPTKGFVPKPLSKPVFHLGSGLKLSPRPKPIAQSKNSDEGLKSLRPRIPHITPLVRSKNLGFALSVFGSNKARALNESYGAWPFFKSNAFLPPLNQLTLNFDNLAIASSFSEALRGGGQGSCAPLSTAKAWPSEARLAEHSSPNASGQRPCAKLGLRSTSPNSTLWPKATTEDEKRSIEDQSKVLVPSVNYLKSTSDELIRIPLTSYVSKFVNPSGTTSRNILPKWGTEKHRRHETIFRRIFQNNRVQISKKFSDFSITTPLTNLSVNLLWPTILEERSWLGTNNRYKREHSSSFSPYILNKKDGLRLIHQSIKGTAKLKVPQSLRRASTRSLTRYPKVVRQKNLGEKSPNPYSELRLDESTSSGQSTFSIEDPKNPVSFGKSPFNSFEPISAKSWGKQLEISSSIYPVEKVNFLIERDDQLDEYRHRIIFEIWTNGSISPRQAVFDSIGWIIKLLYNFREPLKSKI